MNMIDLPELPDTGLLLASGFATRVSAWADQLAREQGGALPREALHKIYRAAWYASRATSDGHVCVLLDQVAEEEQQDQQEQQEQAQREPRDPVQRIDLQAWRSLLLESGVVGTPQAPGACPLVLDDGNRLYLHKYFALEQSLALRLRQRDWQARVPHPETVSLLNRLFESGNREGEADWQKIAAALALLRPVTVISGGPGTGKTTTVANVLACLIADNPSCRIALAAPTGKAAARMLEALQARAGSIPSVLRAAFPVESFTVHRLLGVTPSPGVFRHDAHRPLPYDVLVVDEASMLDLAMAARLFDAVPRTARVILLGDKDQLAAVEAGAVFSELSANPALSPETLAALAEMTSTAPALMTAGRPASARHSVDAVVWLSRNYRFGHDSPIGRFASLMVSGDAAGTVQWLEQGGHAGIDWMPQEGDALPKPALDRAVREFKPYVKAVQQHEAEPGLVFAAFDQFRVLCALRQGERGVQHVNAVLTAALKELLPASAAPTGWYVGRPVIITRNDYTLRLFNGDVGIALRNASGELRVVFQDRELGLREVGIGRLPEHETAFAMTVHRSQGSEFAGVMTILPGQDSRVATRELLYTAVTRAREKVVLVAAGIAVANAVSTSTRRLSGLSARLASLADDTSGKG